MSKADQPDWLTDAVKLRFAEAVIALLARGGGVTANSCTFNSDISEEQIEAVVFPDGEHNIMAWIAADREEPTP